MYQIDKNNNRIQKLQVKRFADLGFGERNHLQEWLANTPEALGEELLIIQKEFDGFDDTRERLDLLALDKEANLVVIENKLDDSGRDVVWQALKYASYCSGLRKEQIIRIFQQYLDRTQPGSDASTALSEFLEPRDLDDVDFNFGNGQRIILVAAKFRKEVTSTVMWLLSHRLRLQCFKVTVYDHDNLYFLEINQIIPTPETKEFLIGISDKETDKKILDTELKQRHKLRLAFWEQALEAFRSSSMALFNNISPSKDNWLNTGSGITGVNYYLIFGKNECRVELGIKNSNGLNQKFLYDELYKRKAEIQSNFGVNSILLSSRSKTTHCLAR